MQQPKAVNKHEVNACVYVGLRARVHARIILCACTHTRRSLFSDACCVAVSWLYDMLNNKHHVFCRIAEEMDCTGVGFAIF